MSIDFIHLHIKAIIQSLIFSNTIISLSGGMLSFGFCVTTQVPNAIYYGIFGFLGTFTIYNFQRLVKQKIAPNDSKHLLWVGENYKLLVALTFISSAGSLGITLFLINLNILTVSLGLAVGLISIFYVVRIGTRSLRDLPFLKIQLISMVWVLALTLLPLLNERITEPEKWFFGLAHYVYFFAICIPFDIRDLPFDNPKQRTIPQVLGIPASKVIGVILLIVFVFIATYFAPNLAQNKLFIVAVLIQVLLIYFTTKKETEIYFGIYIDGAIALLGLSYLI